MSGVRQNCEPWRLLKIDLQSFLESSIKSRIAGMVLKIRKYQLPLATKLRSAAPVMANTQGASRCGERDSQPE